MARVLVIDDEQMVALMIRRTLEHAHDVVVEHSAQAAIDRFLRGDRFDAVVADLHLRDGDAMWIRQQLARIEPALPSRLLVLTGGASTAAETAFLEEPGIRWLQKPFRAGDLLARIDDVVRSSAATP